MTQILRAATLFHEEWRKAWQSRPGNASDTPRWKKTKDEAWLAAHTGQPYCRIEEGEVNINVDFELLPDDWQRDNLEAAEAAIPIARAANEEGWIDFAEYEQQAGALIHRRWLERRRASESESQEFQELDIPFEQLEPWRQEQDMLHARLCRQLLRETA